MLKARAVAAHAVLAVLVLVLSACVPTSTSSGPPPSPEQHHKVGSPVDQPFPSEWNTAAWWIDPGNSSGCASDNNTGTSATCVTGTNTGPLLTWGNLQVQKWGCRGNPIGCPRLRQNTTITFLSSQSGNTDPIVNLPQLEAGAWEAIVGNLGVAQTLTSTTLASVTAKNRATPQLLQAAFSGSALDGGSYTPAVSQTSSQLIVNTTHPSRAWLNAQVSGSTYSVSQPLAAIAAGAYASTATEVDTWANSDAVTIYQPVSLNIVRVQPTVADNNASISTAVYLQTFSQLDPQGAGYDPSYIGSRVVITDSMMAGRWVVLDSTSQDGVASLSNGAGWGLVNVYMGIGMIGGPTAIAGNAAAFFGGVVAATNASTLPGTVFDFDSIVRGPTSAYSAGNVFVASGPTCGGSCWTYAGSSGIAGRGNGEFWGAGTVNAAADCRVSYPAGAGKAAATFVGVTLTVNGGTKGCIMNPAAASAFATCNTTLSAANLDSNCGATTPCCITGAGPAFCNAP